jgi:hypothetical protein
MRKIIKLTEADLTTIIKRVLKEGPFEEIGRLGSEAAKKIADQLTKSVQQKKDGAINTSKSTYDKSTDVINKDLPEFTVNAKKPQTVSGGSYILDMNNPSSKDITVIWGGMPSSQYGAKFMKKEGKGLFTNKNVIYSNYENSLSTLKGILKNNGVKDFRIKSVSGFSRGGINVWGELKGGYDFVGLIDPSTPTLYKSLPNNAKMISRWENWGCCPSYRAYLKQMEKSGLSKRIEASYYNHLEMPKIFFQKYSSSM